MRSVENAIVRHRVAELGDQLEVALARVAAVHALEDAVGAGLERQVEPLAHLGDVAHRADQLGREVVGVRGREADPRDALDVVDPLRTARPRSVGGVRSRP